MYFLELGECNSEIGFLDSDDVECSTEERQRRSSFNVASCITVNYFNGEPVPRSSCFWK